jgi:hypothetical protein
MSILTLIKKREQPKVHHSQYIRTANTPDEAGTEPEPTKVVQTDAAQ